jgi:hypothetical protein
MSIKERIIKILSGQSFMSSLTLGLWLQNPWGFTINSLRCTVDKVWCPSRKGFPRYEWSVYSYVQFDPWPNIYFSRCTTLQSLKPVKLRVFKIISSLHIHISSSTLWPFIFNICSGHLPSMIYKSPKFEVCQAKASQDIEWSVYSFVQFDPSIFDFWPQNQSWSSTSHDVLVYKVWSLSSKGFSRYWVVSILICPVWPLDLWTSK